MFTLLFLFLKDDPPPPQYLLLILGVFRNILRTSLATIVVTVHVGAELAKALACELKATHDAILDTTRLPTIFHVMLALMHPRVQWHFIRASMTWLRSVDFVAVGEVATIFFLITPIIFVLIVAAVAVPVVLLATAFGCQPLREHVYNPALSFARRTTRKPMSFVRRALKRAEPIPTLTCSILRALSIVHIEGIFLVFLIIAEGSMLFFPYCTVPRWMWDVVEVETGYTDVKAAVNSGEGRSSENLALEGQDATSSCISAQQQPRCNSRSAPSPAPNLRNTSQTQTQTKRLDSATAAPPSGTDNTKLEPSSSGPAIPSHAPTDLRFFRRYVTVCRPRLFPAHISRSPP